MVVTLERCKGASWAPFEGITHLDGTRRGLSNTSNSYLPFEVYL